MIAPSEMTPQEAYRLFLVGLQTMNLTVVPKGRTLEIVESNRARETPLPVYRSGNAVPGQDQVVRVVLRPEHISVEEMTAVVNAMKTSTGVVAPIPSAGAIILTDYGSSIDKLMEVMREVDAPTGTEKIYIIYLQNADAQDVAQKLGEIFGIGRAAGAGGGVAPPMTAAQRRAAAQQGANPPQPGAPNGAAAQGGSSTPSKIIPDTRTNSLIVIASERAYQRILALVRRLDFAAGGEATGTIHVYYLSNADAEQLAGTMNTLITGVAPQRAQPQAGGRPTNVPAAVTQQQAGAGAFEGQIKLTFDKPTNSLVIVSSPKDFYSLREVIRRLDKPRRQVFVEATIVEVSLDKTRKLGFSYHGGAQFELKNADDTTLFGGVEHKQLNSILTSPASLDGLIGGVIGPQIPGLSIPSIGVLFQLVQNNNEVNVLSTPNILTTDNEPAEISVGQNIPYQSSALGGLGNLGNLAQQQGQNQNTVNPLLGLGSLGQSISRQDVALTLKLTPHVSESDFVRLEVDLEISDILSENFGGNGPSWSKRRVKTPIVVRDQQPVVIGGLMSDKISQEESKVPLLGDIPLLGYLFKYQVKRKVKTNLLIFLTPYVIKDQSDIQRIFEQKVDERREFIRAYSSFEEREFDIHVDYRRKRGLLEEINKALIYADEDERAQREAEQSRQLLGEEGPVEMPPDLGVGDPDGVSPEGVPPPPPMPPPMPPEGE
jgi:general secretion pathway protein D